MFPFWIARKASGLPAEVIVDSDCLAAFTSLKTATAFMERAGETKWTFQLVGRADFHTMAHDWRRHGLVAMCLDPGHGERVSFDALDPAL
jgi:hypothetical protein